MRIAVAGAVLAVVWLGGQLPADVIVTEHADRVTVRIDGRLFTEWRHQDWVAPFLYPVMGPNGVNLTRHFPMQTGVAGEEQDHPHHRSLRFSHSDVNGFNFWWAPGQEKAGHTAEIQLEKIEKLVSGSRGKIVLWNRWLGDGKLVLRERVQLEIEPLANQQILMDYDIELHAAEAPVVFGDKRDGGMLVRVANTMKVESETGEPALGTIVNSRGQKNAAAWGQRAEWTDYSGPDSTGQIVGITIFDHPANLRFPTHWHARKYGLMTANRFGTDHFRGNYDDHKTVVCQPQGDNCPACQSHSGDYTIPAGQSLQLWHRFFIHRGDATAARIAEQFDRYTADPLSILYRMRALAQSRLWTDLLTQFGDVDFAAWSPEFVSQASEALTLRGQALMFQKRGADAQADLLTATRLNPKNLMAWMSLGDNSASNLHDDARALAAYRESLAITGSTAGWQPLTCTLSMVRILTDQLKTEEALALLRPYDELATVAPNWRIRLLRAYGDVYAAQGKEQESLAKFRQALELESPK